MDSKIKTSFDYIQAEDELKRKTLAFVKEQTNEYRKKKVINYRYFIATAACVFFLLIVGNQFYFSPTVKISIDINPSIELGINRFNKVVSIKGYNEDGKKLAELLHVKFQNYKDAIAKLLEEKSITNLLSKDAVMTITIVGENEIQANQMLANIETYTTGHHNTYCYLANSEEVSNAHELGLSYGKYRAFLEVSALDPNITIEQIQNMTMREIHNLIWELSNDEEIISNENTGNTEKGHHGYGHGNNNGNGGKGKQNRGNHN